MTQLTDWQEQIRQALADLREQVGSVDALSLETGITENTLYLILSGDRGTGSQSLETLRLTQPDLVAGVFCVPGADAQIER